MENAAERIALLLSEMRAAKPGIVITRRFRQDAHGWIAEVRAGFANGARPCWGGRGQDEATALLQATERAHHYWVKTPAGG